MSSTFWASCCIYYLMVGHNTPHLSWRNQLCGPDNPLPCTSCKGNRKVRCYIPMSDSSECRYPGQWLTAQFNPLQQLHSWTAFPNQRPISSGLRDSKPAKRERSCIKVPFDMSLLQHQHSYLPQISRFILKKICPAFFFSSCWSSIFSPISGVIIDTDDNSGFEIFWKTLFHISYLFYN